MVNRARFQTAPVPITERVTYPGAPPDFTAQVLFSAPAAATYDPNATVATVDFTFFAPATLSPSQMVAVMQTFLNQAPTFGWTVLAYEIDSKPVGEITVPSEICLGSLPCIPLPTSICVPNIPPDGNCWFTIDLGGATIATGYAYRLWLCLADPGESPYQVALDTAPGGARANTRALLPALIIGLGDALAILVILIGLVYVYEVLSGKIAFGQISETVSGIASGVGQIPVPALNAAELPLVFLGVAMIVSGVAIPVFLNANASVPIPGGGTVSGGGSIGGTPGKR